MDSAKKWSLIGAFSFGVVFVVAIVAIALLRPNPTAFEYTVFRIVIALAAAGVGAVLPGFLDVSFKNVLRAGGALAIFVIVYFFAPVVPTPVDDQTVVEPKSDAKIPSDKWLTLIDKLQFDAAYADMAPGFRDRYPFSQFRDLVSREREALGTPTERTLVSTTPYVSPPGAPKGAYRQYIYRTQFSSESRAIYESIWLFAHSGQWMVSGFYTFTKTEAGQFVPYEPPNASANRKS